ncbi:steroid 17-alpha-hydroxylase/17,20 lyase-like [Saccostrea echinata]|uniref:steroid 17-alpha-hydroxylase/17,20 lyase-like n=1 Tax=Saccostrea echinata TaxID=191078 RepID=UPI002A828E78|nr:steroid 17-alpha-hydroxylase/17,20 lyase-like [Saccostrea echinata]
MFIFLNDYDVAMEALVKRKTDFAGRPAMRSLEVFSQGSGISFSPYSEPWKINRKVASVALRNFLKSKVMDEIIENKMIKFMDKMSAVNKPLAAKEYLNKIQFHILYTLCFGKSTDEEIENFIQRVEEIDKTFGGGFREDIYPIFEKLWPSKNYCQYVKLVNNLLHIFYGYLEEHKRSFDKNNIRDITDQLLLCRNEAEESHDEEVVRVMNDTRILQTVLAVFYAGVDTTRMAMDWFVCFMSGIPEIQEKCRQEIDSVIGTRRPSINDRPNLPFTEACVYETLRLGNVAAFGLPHSTLCDTQVGGYDIPKDTTVMINIYAIHLSPRYWKTPEKFDPYRFLTADGKLEGKPDGWLPFAAGVRSCLGEALAKSEIVTLCAYLLQRFEFRLPDGVDPDFTGVCSGLSGTEIPTSYDVVLKDRFA